MHIHKMQSFVQIMFSCNILVCLLTIQKNEWSLKLVENVRKKARWQRPAFTRREAWDLLQCPIFSRAPRSFIFVNYVKSEMYIHIYTYIILHLCIYIYIYIYIYREREREREREISISFWTFHGKIKFFTMCYCYIYLFKKAFWGHCIHFQVYTINLMKCKLL